MVSETALAAGVSEQMARGWLSTGTTLATRALPITADGLRDGRLDWAKATAVAGVLADRGADVAAAAEALVVPDTLLPEAGDLSGRAPHVRSVPVLRSKLREALLTLDPDDGEGPTRERDARRVSLKAVTDTMGELSAYLPLDKLALVGARLDAAAEAARAARDPRSADQVRADTLTDLLLASRCTHCSGTGVTAHAEDAGERGWGVRVHLAIPFATLLGLSTDPGYLDGFGPIAADLARDLATGGTFRCVATDDEHGTVLGLGQRTYRDGYTPGQRLQDLSRTVWRRCAYPGCATRATTSRCDLDHAEPWPEGVTCDCNVQPLCRRHHRMKTHGRIVLERSTDPADPPGTRYWRLPTGRVYRSCPEPLVPHLRPPTSQEQGVPAPGSPGNIRPVMPDADEPPPF